MKQLFSHLVIVLYFILVCTERSVAQLLNDLCANQYNRSLRRLFWGSIFVMVTNFAFATNFTVTNLNNTGAGSLRKAITDVNADPTATALAPHVIDITIAGQIDLTAALPVINNHMTLNGHALGNIINRLSGTFGIMEVGLGGWIVSLSNLSFKNGQGSLGGGLYVKAGTTFLNRCSFLNNTATSGGGGLFTEPAVDTFSMVNCTFSGNNSSFGGAIYNNCPASWTNCTVANNNATNSGGIVYNNQLGELYIRNGLFANNTGGGVHWHLTASTGNIIFQTNNLSIDNCGGCGQTWAYNSNANLGALTLCGNLSHYPLLAGSNALDNGTPIGSPLTDICGDTRDATPNIGSWEPFVLPGSSLHFDGVNDFIDCGNHPSLDLTEEVTVEAWVRATNTSLQGRLVYNGGGFSQFGYGLHFTAMDELRAEIQGPGGALAVDYPMPSPLTWHYVAFSYSNSKDSIWVYIDGVKVSQTFCGIGSLGLFPGNLTIGGISGGGTGENFEGDIDEVRIWNRALCHNEIAARKNCQPNTTDPGLVAYYNFNQGIAAGSNPTVIVALDALGNSPGTLNNFALNGTTSNWVDGAANGVIGTCPTIALPEANIFGNAVEIFTGDISPSVADDTDFGASQLGTPISHIFEIHNPSADDLTITAINITGANASDFTEIGHTFPFVIPASSMDLFTIDFTPSGTGARTAMVQIVSDDCNENPYLFNVQGIGAVPGTGLHFDGVDDHVNLGANNITELRGAPKATMEAWVRLDNQGLFDKLVATVNGTLRLQVQTGGRAKVAVRNGADQLVGTAALGTIPVGGGIWRHFAVVYDGTQTGNTNILKCYINGTPVALTYTLTGSVPTTIDPSPTNFVMVGASFDLGCPQCFWDGAMDEVRIWCKARTATEIQASMNCELAGTEAGLVAYYNFNQGIADGNNTTITNLTDLSLNNYPSVLNNFTKTGIGSNFTDVTINGVAGNCNLPSPSILLVGNTVPIYDGSNIPNVADDTEFGTAFLGTSVVHNFIIDNTLGSADLVINNINLGGANPTEFAIGGITFPATISPGTVDTFTVTFVPATTGALSAIVNIDNNGICGDYDFALQGFAAPACPYDNAFVLDMTPAYPGDTVSQSCILPGQYVTVNVQLGEEYTFSTCTNTSGNDTELTLYDNTGTIVLGYDDNACGINSEIIWTATFTGVVHVLLDQWVAGLDCQHSSTCTALKVASTGVVATTCGDIIRLCVTNTGTTFLAPIGIPDALITDPGNDYNCMGNATNPTWHYLEITNSGDINMTLSAANDIDFLIWGPFADLPTAVSACGVLGTAGFGSVVDCSYSSSAVETPDILGAVAGEIYVMMITNYAAVGQPVTIIQTAGAGAANCTSVACNISSNDPVCAGDTLRLFDNNATGISWSWTGPNGFTSTDQNPIIPSATAVNAGMYSVTITDGGGTVVTCNLNVTVIDITPNVAVTSNYNGAQIRCNGGADGIATSTPFGGTVPYTWQWSASAGNQTTATATGLTAGSHSVTVTDDTGCSKVGIITLTQPPAIVITMGQTNISCFGANDGTITASITGGTAPYNFFWSASVGGQTTSTVTGLAVGTHSITVQDLNSCSAASSVTITSPAPLAVTPTVTNVQCFGDSTGVIAVTGSGGVAPYTFLWSNGATTATITGLLAGSYIVTTTDFNSCIGVDNIGVIQNPPIPTPDISAVDTMVCVGEDIQLLTSTAAIGYYWSGPNGFISNQQNPVIATADPSNQGLYTLYIEDANGCFSPDTSIFIMVNSEPYLGLTIAGGPDVCIGDQIMVESITHFCDSFLWIGPVQNQAGVAGTNFTLVNFGEPNYVTGIWTLQGMDTTTGCVSISNPIFINLVTPPPFPIPTGNNPICVGDAAVVAVPNVVGATINWYLDSLKMNLIGLGANFILPGVTTDTTLYVEYVIANCFSGLASITINVATSPTPNAPADFAVCENAQINLFTSTIASVYNWSGPNGFTSNTQNPVIPTATSADAGLYTLSVIDTNGCLSPDTTVFVTVNANPLPPSALSNSPVCFGQDLQIFHAGGCHRTHWVTPSAVVITTTTDTLTITSTQSEYLSGGWQVICEDTILGCFSTPTLVNVTIHPPMPLVNAFNNGPVCVGEDVSLSIPIVAGATYTWYADSLMTILIGSGSTVLVSNMTQDSTFYVLIDILGCFDTSFTTVIVNPTPLTPNIPADFAVCTGDSILLGTSTITAGYLWTMPSGATLNAQNFNIFPATAFNTGLYTLSIIDANGCPSLDTTVFVTVNALPPTPTITSLPVCMGAPLVLVASGNCDMVEWTGPVSAPILDNDTLNVPSTAPNYVNNGVWTVRCVDTTTGCFSLVSAPYNVSINPMVFPPAVSNNSPVCIGATVQLSSPVVANTTYTWYAADSVTIVASGSTVNIPNITANTSFVLEITRNGCSAMAATFVTVFPPSPAPLVSDTIKVCPSDTIFLGTPTFATAYNWSGPNGFASTLQNPTIFPASAVNAGTYTLSTLDINGCPAPDTTVEVVIHALPLPPVISSPNSTICYDDSLFLNSSANCGQLWWEGPTGVPFLRGANISLDNLDLDFITGNWTVTCIDTFTGCLAISAPFAVVINPMPPTPPLSSNSPVCVGDSVNLSMGLVAGATYQWSDSANNTLGTTPNISVLVTNTSMFYAEVTVNGCTSMDSILVIVNPIPPTPDAFTFTNPVCEGDFIQVNTLTVAPIYNWSGPNGFSSNAQNPFVFPVTISNAGTYFLNIIDFNGCQSLDTFVNIVVTPQPPQPVISGTTNFCAGDTIFLQTQICHRLTWLPPVGPGPIIITGSDSLVIAPGTPNYGSGPWQVVCQDTITGCSSIASFSHIVNLNPSPTPPATFNSGPVCMNESATLNVVPQNTSTYIWYADSLLTDTIGFGTTITVDSLQADSTFYVQIINAAGCNIVGSTTVLVYPMPTPAIAAVLDSVVCVGEDLFLQELGGGVAHFWTGTSGYLSNIQSPIINSVGLLDAGTYTVFVTDLNGCLSQGASVNVYVNAPAVPPVISGGSNICFGDSIILTTSFACDSMVWFGAMGTIQGFGNQLAIPALNAQYGSADWTLMCFDTITGCNSISNTIFVNILLVPPTPIITHNGAACFGDSIVLSTPLVIGAINNWYADSLATIFLGTGNSIAVGSIVTDSTYYLVQTVNGCSSPIASTTVFLIPTSPAPIVPADFAVCIGGTINLSTPTIASAYLWTHANGFNSTAQNPSISPATVADGGTYTLSTIDLNGCPAPDTTINVIVNPLPPAPIIFANDPTCQGDTMSFGSNIPSNVLVQWATPSSNVIPGLFNMNIAPTDANYLAGLWTVIFTDTITGCQITDDTLLSIDIMPTGTATTSSPVCVGDSVVLSSPTIAGVTSYLWYRVDGLQLGTGQNITIPNIISDTVFGLVVITTAGCDYLIDSVFVNVLPQTPAPPITVDTLVCVGEAIQFTTAPAIAYNWTGSNGFVSSAQNPLIAPATLTDAGSYTLNVIDINGCTSLDSTVNIVVNTPPIAPVASAPAIVCAGDTLFLSSNANTCDTAYWIGGNGSIIIGGANVVIPPSSPNYISGNWQVFCVDTLAGCETGSNIINVLINPLPIAVAVNNGPVCINETVQLTANFVTNATYTWYSDALLTNIVGTNQVILVDSISVDSTFYLVITDINGCNSLVANTNVNVQIPAPAPNVGADIVVCEGEDFTLTTSTFSFGYNWTGPNGFVSNQINPTIQNATLADSGLYTLTVLGLNGCPSEDTTIHVTIDSLPNAPVINGFIYMCVGDTLFLNADSTSGHCDAAQWVGPNGQSMAITGSNIAIAPGDTNYLGGFWQLQCIDTTTGCFSSSNLSLVIIFPTQNTQPTYTSSPVCIGSSVALSTDTAGVLMNYTWYADSTLTNISGTGQYVTVNGITSDTTFYLVITNLGGCSSNPIPTLVTVLTPANPPSIPADTQYCVGEPISLSTTTLATTYVWSSPNGFVSNQQNPIVTLAASVVDSGTYILYTMDSTGCRSADTSLHITVNPLPPIPSIAHNSPLCDGDTLILTSSTICDNAQWIGPYGTNPAVLGSPGSVLWTYGSAAVIPPTDSNYQNSDWYMICIDTFTGCTSMSDTITVTINPNPIVASISTTGAVCAGDSVSLTTTVSSTNNVFYVWYADAGLTTPIAIGGNPVIPNVTANTTFYVQVTDAVTGCITLDSIAIVLNPTPPAPILPNGLVLCEGDLINLTTSTTAIGYNWSGPNGFISNQQNPIPFIGTTLDSGLYTLSIIDANGCTSLMGTIVVSVNDAPAIPAVTSNSPSCTGDSVTLGASTAVGATYEWFHLPNNTSVGFGQNLTLSNLTLADTGYYYVVATTNGCSAISDSTLVTIYTNNSAPANAGIDTVLCGLDTITLYADATIQPVIGTWTSSTGAIIINPNSNNSFVANLAVGTNIFYWTLSTANCPAYSTDSVIVNVAPPSTDIANAGVNQNLCGDSTTTLSATLPNISTGIWTQSLAQIQAGILISNDSIANPTISNMQPGNTYTFVWQLSNGICGIHSTDTVLITVNTAPAVAAIAGVDIVTCSQGIITLAATSPTVGTGLWTTNSSAIIINPNQNNTIVTNLPQGATMFVWTLSNGTCTDYASDTMFVTLGGATPVANADYFTVTAGSSITTIDVLPNDNLTSNWTINLNVPINSGTITNLNNGEFDLDLQGVTTNQSFIYELCNPACPANCDTAIVTLTIQQTIPCVIPNIFTPNSDGVNDFFEIPCLDILQRTKLMVFNRWGDLVYDTDAYNNQWDGTHNGQPLPDGTYFFIMKMEDQDEIQNSIEIRR